MQILKFSKEEYNKLYLTKSVTIRLGRKNVNLGLCGFNKAYSDLYRTANITSVTYTKLRYVKIEDLINDGFVSLEHALKRLSEFYKDISLEDEVTVINFEMV